jgi:hypothetical protein
MTETKIDMNDGVQIILNRMKTNPEEFFDEGGRWRWMFKETMREVLTEPEKAAIYEGMKTIRRIEFTARAASTVLRADEQIEKDIGYAEAAFAEAQKRINSPAIPVKRSLKDLL